MPALEGLESSPGKSELRLGAVKSTADLDVRHQDVSYNRASLGIELILHASYS